MELEQDGVPYDVKSVMKISAKMGVLAHGQMENVSKTKTKVILLIFFLYHKLCNHLLSQVEGVEKFETNMVPYHVKAVMKITAKMVVFVHGEMGNVPKPKSKVILLIYFL